MQQSESDKIKSEVLTAFMQVLKPLVITLMAEGKMDGGRMASVLAAAADDARLEPAAREILSQLAEGLAMIGGASKPRH